MNSSTRWSCEKCGGTRVITYPANADVYAVVELLRADHAAYAPSCETDLSRIRVAVAPLLTDAARPAPSPESSNAC